MELSYCDNCGNYTSIPTLVWIGTLPKDIESANAGESACVCSSCASKILEEK